MWKETREAWTSRKGKLVLSIWGTAISSLTIWAYLRRNQCSSPHEPDESSDSKHNDNASVSKGPELIAKRHEDQMWSLWRIKHRIYPSWSSRSCIYTLSLPLVMSIWYLFRGKVSKQNSRLASWLTHKEWDKLFEGTVDLALLSIPASILGKMMSATTQRMTLSVRTNLVKHYASRYLSLSPYLLSLEMGPDDYAEQHITLDIDRFSSSFCDLWNAALWSVGGVGVLSLSLIHKMGAKELCLAICYSYCSRRLITALSPSFSDLTHQIQVEEAKWRATHSKIAEYSEEVSIASGWKATHHEDGDEEGVEQRVLSLYYQNVERSLLDYYVNTMVTEMMGSYFTGEMGKLIGYMAMVPAVFSAENEAEEDTVGYLTSVVQELTFLTKLFERAFRIRKQWDEVSGLALRIYEMECALQRVEERLQSQSEHRRYEQVAEGESVLMLNGVSIVTPNGEQLLEDLTMEIKEGEHTFIEGPNGVGKTSIFRVIAGLWAPWSGTVEIKQSRSGRTLLLFLSQRPYLVPHLSIKQQVSYPVGDGVFGDEEIVGALQMVGLYHVIESRGGIDDCNVMAGLSGGEIQRIGMARCLLHRPVFALLDECSSAVSVDMTHSFFTQCIERNITLITIAHDTQLAKYHKQILNVSKGNWKVTTQ